MSIANGQDAVADTWNNGFLSKTVNSDTEGKIGLKNVDTESGAEIANAQKFINLIAGNDGTTGENDTTAKNYATQNVITNGDSRKQALEKLDAVFDPINGHTHDGANSPKIDASQLTGINQFRADWEVTQVVHAGGFTKIMSTTFMYDRPLSGSGSEGVPVAEPQNRCELREYPSENYIEDAEGQRVYARLSNDGSGQIGDTPQGVWTLSFYTMEAGVETAYNLPAQNFYLAYKRVFSLANYPTYSASFGVFSSFDLAADIPEASETVFGKVKLANAAPVAVGSANAKGSSTDAAREDHQHEGVHSIQLFGVLPPGYNGDVTLEQGEGITYSNSSGRLKISARGTPAQTTFDFLNNGTVQDITGLIFAPATYISALIMWTAYRKSTGSATRVQRGSLLLDSDGTTWTIAEGLRSPGIDPGVEFRIDDTTGQIKLVADTQAGTSVVNKLIYSIADLVGTPP